MDTAEQASARGKGDVAAPVPPRASWLGALAGVVAAGLAVTVGMLVASIIDTVSPIDAVGGEFIDHVPVGLRQWAIDNFGHHDKAALKVAIFLVIGILAAVFGALSFKRPWIGLAGIGVFGVLGAIVAVGRPQASGGAAIPPIFGAIVGMMVLYQLVRTRRPDTGPRRVPGPSQAPLGWDRRRFLVATGAGAAGALVAAGLSIRGEAQRVSTIRQSIPTSLPPVADAAAAIPAGATVVETTPFITPNDRFYRIDTALSFPRIGDVNKWKLDIKGLVDHPFSISYAELSAMPQLARPVTLTCVSNDVGGELVSTAVFQGVSLKALLDRAGVQAGAEQLFSTSLDGWTSGFPIDVALDGRDAMVALGMNGVALPLEHGFPARLVVPGLYGYVSATKWLSTIEINHWNDAQGFWVPLGWSKLGPITTESRIDVPRSQSTIAAGPQKIAGVAWAQHRGIAKVEVQIDGGEWQEARMATDVSNDTWRQWVFDGWVATPGTHVILARATDKSGETQTGEDRTPGPDGATGYPQRTVRVE